MDSALNVDDPPNYPWLEGWDHELFLLSMMVYETTSHGPRVSFE